MFGTWIHYVSGFIGKKRPWLLHHVVYKPVLKSISLLQEKNYRRSYKAFWRIQNWTEHRDTLKDQRRALSSEFRTQPPNKEPSFVAECLRLFFSTLLNSFILLLFSPSVFPLDIFIHMVSIGKPFFVAFLVLLNNFSLLAVDQDCYASVFSLGPRFNSHRIQKDLMSMIVKDTFISYHALPRARKLAVMIHVEIP